MASTTQGQLLVAANQLRDPNFFRTVILMIAHTDENAMGLVINRPSSISLDAAMAELPQPSASTDTIYSGGPVETAALYILHSSGNFANTDSEVTRGVYLTGSSDSFEQLLEAQPSPENDVRFRIYCGYAGWGAGQLDAEIERGDWRVLSGDRDVVFSMNPYDIWESCHKKVLKQSRLLPHDVRNPEWN